MTIPLWLELAKTAISAVTPIAAGAAAYFVARASTSIERTKISNQELTKRRIATYDAVGTHLNDIYCFIQFVGHWKELSPENILEKKRLSDRKMYVERPFFSPRLIEHYDTFMQTCFSTYHGYGIDAKICIDHDVFTQHWESQPQWNAKWLEYLDTTVIHARGEINRLYRSLVDQFAEEITLTPPNHRRRKPVQ